FFFFFFFFSFVLLFSLAFPLYSLPLTLSPLLLFPLSPHSLLSLSLSIALSVCPSFSLVRSLSPIYFCPFPLILCCSEQLSGKGQAMVWKCLDVVQNR